MYPLLFLILSYRNRLHTRGLQKGDYIIKRCVLAGAEKIRTIVSTEGRKTAEY